MAKGFSAEDLLNFTFISDPQISPDGKQLVFIQRTINEKKKYESSLYIQNIETKQVNRFTQGNSKDSSPCWSPDGKTIAFVSDRSGKGQIWLIQANGGEARPLTDFPNGASQPVWSPDGQKILVTTSLAEDESINDQPKKDDEKDNELKPYITTRLAYKSDASGFFEDKYSQLILVDVATGETTQLTDGPFDHEGGTFSLNGNKIAFSADRSDDPDRNLISDIYEINLADNKLTKLTDSGGVYHTPNYSPDGTKLSILGNRREYSNATLTRIHLLNLETKEMASLTQDWDVQADDVAINDMGTGAGNKGAIWSTNGHKLFFLASENGETQLYTVDLVGKIVPITSGSHQVYAFSLSDSENQAVLAISRADVPGDLFLFDIESGKETRLRESNAALLKERSISVPEQIVFQARDGWSLEGWVMKPVGYKEGEKYPLVLEIHGGPHMMYSHGFMHEFQVLTSKGYGVLYINPRGSHGYGQEFVDAVRGDYGGGDYHDLMDAVDYAVENFNWIDADRVGVTGGSYGGFMTNWIVGHTNRFKAAVTQRSISNWISFYGVSDIGYFFTEWEMKTDLLGDQDMLWKHSPLRYVKNVETPLLILHSEKDYRCPIEQGEQLYVALKHQGKTTKLIRFPESNHELSRNGNPNLRIARLNEIVGWFNEHL
ncbi:S9 family peptidase [Bacillaceae bacterium S4-13-56]